MAGLFKRAFEEKRLRPTDAERKLQERLVKIVPNLSARVQRITAGQEKIDAGIKNAKVEIFSKKPDLNKIRAAKNAAAANLLQIEQLLAEAREIEGMARTAGKTIDAFVQLNPLRQKFREYRGFVNFIKDWERSTRNKV